MVCCKNNVQMETVQQKLFKIEGKFIAIEEKPVKPLNLDLHKI